MTLTQARQAKEASIDIAPGDKLCKRCYQEFKEIIAKDADDVGPSASQASSTYSNASSVKRFKAESEFEKLNNALRELGVEELTQSSVR